MGCNPLLRFWPSVDLQSSAVLSWSNAKSPVVFGKGSCWAGRNSGVTALLRYRSMLCFASSWFHRHGYSCLWNRTGCVPLSEDILKAKSKRMILSLDYLSVPDAFACVANCDPRPPLDVVLCHLLHKCAQCCVVAGRDGVYLLLGSYFGSKL